MVIKRFINKDVFLLGMNEESLKIESKDKNLNEEKLINVPEVLSDEGILEKTGREYYESGKEDLIKERFNSALVLFFKSLISFCDLFLLKKQRKAPSSHNNRFRITKQFFPDVYKLLDKDFPFYVDSYGKIISKTQVEAIKYDAEVMATKAEIKL